MSDPSSIATYAQMDAPYGCAIRWTMLFTFPLMAAIREISTRIGRVTRPRIAGNLRQHSPLLPRVIVALLPVANIINFGTDGPVKNLVR